MIDWINMIGNAVGHALLDPLNDVSPWLAMAVASLYLAVIALLAFKFCSNQTALLRRRDEALARLLELQLFKDDLAGIFGAFCRILAAVGRYLLQSLKPLAAMALPLGILLVQIAGWLPYRPLRPGESALVTVSLDDRVPLPGTVVTARSSGELVIETEPFVSAQGHEVLWRIRPHSLAPGGWIDIAVDGETLRKTVSVAQRGLARTSCQRVRGGVGARLLNPFERALPKDSAIRAIAIGYPPRHLFLGSHRVNAMVGLFVLSLAFGLLLKRPLRVEF